MAGALVLAKIDDTPMPAALARLSCPASCFCPQEEAAAGGKEPAWVRVRRSASAEEAVAERAGLAAELQAGLPAEAAAVAAERAARRAEASAWVAVEGQVCPAAAQ